jgi:hypothetical protein
MLVVPVPLHHSKHSQRGFNQARALAVNALEALGKSHPQWRLKLAAATLMRQRATESQAGLTRRQRRLNVRGAFAVSDPAAVAGKHILLIDDIFTTGATARAAAQALTQAGAESVWVATLARARSFQPRGSLARFDGTGAEGARFEGEEDNPGLASNALDSKLQGAFSLSSHDQPPF